MESLSERFSRIAIGSRNKANDVADQKIVKVELEPEKLKLILENELKIPACTYFIMSKNNELEKRDKDIQKLGNNVVLKKGDNDDDDVSKGSLVVFNSVAGATKFVNGASKLGKKVEFPVYVSKSSTSEISIRTKSPNMAVKRILRHYLRQNKKDNYL